MNRLTADSDVVKLSSGNWIALLTVAVSIAGSTIGAAWRFSAEVTATSAELKVELRSVREKVTELSARVARLEHRARLAQQ